MRSHMITRRKFLCDYSTAAAAMALFPMSFDRKPALSGNGLQCLDQMSYPVLAGQINTVFRVCLSPRQVVELKLIKAPLAPPTPVKPGGRLPGDAGNEKFSLIFSGLKDEFIPDAIHRVEHGQLGRFDMYIGQIGARDTDQSRYETVFNRPAPTASRFIQLT
jgi:hypothetical protein